MARIDASSLKNWNDGETMHESDYEQEREILRTAINDNDDRVRVLENANLGILSRIRSGIAFPTLPTPVTGDLFYRTDENKHYYFNGTAWTSYANISDIVSTYAKKTQDTWTQAVLQNGWTHKVGAPTQYRLNEFGQLELRGGCTGGTTAGNTLLFTIPSSLLSTSEKIFRVTGVDGSSNIVTGSACWIHATNGELRGYGALPVTVLFDGLVFSK